MVAFRLRSGVNAHRISDGGSNHLSGILQAFFDFNVDF